MSPLLRVSKGLNQGHGRIRLFYASSRDGFTANLTQMCAKSLQLYPTLLAPWIVAPQTPLHVELSRQEHWSTVSFPIPGDLSDPGIEPKSLAFPALSGEFFTTRATWEALQPHPNCWSNSVLCEYKDEIFMSLLAVSWGPVFSPMSCLHCFLCIACNHLQQWWVEFLLCFRSLHLLSVAFLSLQLEEALCF